MKIPLPPPGQYGITVVTVKVTAPKGKSVGSLRAKAKNPAVLKPPGSPFSGDAVAAVPRSPRKRSATVRIYVQIFRAKTAAMDPMASEAQGDFLTMAIFGPVGDALSPGPAPVSKKETCENLQKTEIPGGERVNLLQDVPKETYDALVQATHEKPEKQWDADTSVACRGLGLKVEPIDDGDG